MISFTRLSVFSLFFLQALSSQNEQITCDIPPVEENQSTYLTCYYKIDMALERRKFSVVYFDSDDQPPVSVLDCRWEDEDSQPTCQPSNGFQTPEIKGSEIRIRLLQASASNVGKYSCNMEKSLPTHSMRCSFSLLQPDSASGISDSVAQAAQVEQPPITPKEDPSITAAVNNEYIQSSTSRVIVTVIFIFLSVTVVLRLIRG